MSIAPLPAAATHPPALSNLLTPGYEGGSSPLLPYGEETERRAKLLSTPCIQNPLLRVMTAKGWSSDVEREDRFLG